MLGTLNIVSLDQGRIYSDPYDRLPDASPVDVPVSAVRNPRRRGFGFAIGTAVSTLLLFLVAV